MSEKFSSPSLGDSSKLQIPHCKSSSMELFCDSFEQRNQPEIIPLSYLRICQVVQVSTRTNERQRLGTDTTNDREGDKYSNSRSEEY